MKSKLLSVLLCVAMLMSVAIGAAGAEEHPAHLTVIATTYPLYDIAFQLGGGHLNVIYQPEVTAESLDIADILLCMGGENDAWTAKLDDVTVVRAMEGIDLIEGDENVLTIPINNMIVASYLCDVLCAADSAHSENYVKNSTVYIEMLIALDLSIRDAISDQIKVYCADGSMAYFAKEYGVEIVDTEEDAVTLNVYEHPTEGDLTVPYLELMQRNLEALLHAN